MPKKGYYVPTGRPRGRPRKHPLPGSATPPEATPAAPAVATPTAQATPEATLPRPSAATATSSAASTASDQQAEQLRRVAIATKAMTARAHAPLTDDALTALRAGNRTLSSHRARRVLLSRILDASLTGRLDWHRVNSAIGIIRAAGDCNDGEGVRRDLAELMKFRDEVIRGRAARQDGERLDLSDQVAAAARAIKPAPTGSAN